MAFIRYVLDGYSYTIEGFEEHLREMGIDVVSHREWEDYVIRNPEKFGLSQEHVQNFLSVIRRYNVNGHGLVPIELAAFKAANEIDTIRRLGGFVPFEREPDQPREPPQFRLSELSRDIEDAGKPVERNEKLDFGSVAHTIMLNDPPEDMQKGFAPYYYMYAAEIFGPNKRKNVILEPLRRRGYCEVVHFLDMEFEDAGRSVRVYTQLTPDAVFVSKIGNKSVIIDAKSGLATPFHPHVRYQRQIDGYGLGLKERFGIEPGVGVILYLDSLGRMFQLKDFAPNDKLHQKVNSFALDYLQVQLNQPTKKP